MYALIDCNNFYVSCERIFAPNLINKPVLVLSNNDGCVISRSNEVKDLGIKMGAVVFELEDLIKQNNIHVFSSNFALYGNISNRIVNVLKTFSPNIEIYSIDESFLYFEKDDQDFLNLAKKIREKILKEIGVPVSIGIAKTKTLAKMASKIEKRGCGYFIINDNNLNEVLEKNDIEEIWGIGRNLTKRLNKFNIKTAYDLICQDEEFIKKITSINIKRTISELKGIECYKLEKYKVPKTMNHTRSLFRPKTNLKDLSELISEFSLTISNKLFSQKLMCGELCIFLKYVEDNKGKYLYAKTTFTHTNYPPEIIKYSTELLNKIHINGKRYKKVGVLLNDILPEKQITQSLLDTKFEAKQNILSTLRNINSKYSNNFIRPSSVPFKSAYIPNVNKISKKYTTSWDELLIVK